MFQRALSTISNVFDAFKTSPTGVIKQLMPTPQGSTVPRSPLQRLSLIIQGALAWGGRFPTWLL
jgi:hypothetical protein